MTCATSATLVLVNFFKGVFTFPSSAMEFSGLSFEPGKKLEQEFWRSLGVHVTHSVFDRASFFLVAAFGRCKFRLFSESVGTLLQATIGGSAKQFYVSQLGDRTFKFVVSTKSVGLFVANLRSFSPVIRSKCSSFSGAMVALIGVLNSIITSLKNIVPGRLLLPRIAAIPLLR